ncbi:MAG: YjfB family protein [Oscillospiraceae bacterium]|nr:YjfB family protein [Oscillospiraceae bacterium]
MGVDISSSIANLSVGMNMAKAKTQVSVNLLDKVMTESADLAVAMLDMLPSTSVSEIGGLLDTRA